MKKALAAVMVLSLASIAACGWCLWSVTRPAVRTLANIDIGGNRTVRIWSEEDQREWGISCIYYQIAENGEEIVPTMFLGTDRNEQFEFKAAFADNGRLACVWQSNPKSWIIIYDHETQESWPQVWWCEQRGEPRDWEGRYQRLRAENPTLPDRGWSRQ